MKRRIKKLKRRFRRNLYHTLLFLSEFDFKRLLPYIYGICFAALFAIACLLPTTTRNNRSASETAYGASVASAIRLAVSEHSAVGGTADVVAVFLPDNYETLSEEEFLRHYEASSLYSFYLTGTELFRLAEGAVSAAPKDSVLYLDGLHLTCHENRLPFDRVLDLTLADSTAIAADETLYRVVTTEEIFALFHYSEYRSMGFVKVQPKNADGIALSDYQIALLTKESDSLTTALALYFSSFSLEDIAAAYAANGASGYRTTLGGFNLIALWRSPSASTWCIIGLFFCGVVLLWYAFPRIRRVHIWFRIHAIRNRKRASRTSYFKRRREENDTYYRRY